MKTKPFLVPLHVAESPPIHPTKLAWCMLGALAGMLTMAALVIGYAVTH